MKFDTIKDRALSELLRDFINLKIQEYGEVILLDIKFQS